MPVPFKELAGSPIETYTLNGTKAQRQILCAWEDRLAMAAALLGNNYEYGGSAHAAYPGRTYLAATQVRIEPFHARPDDQGTFNEITAQLNSYSGQYAQLTIVYELWLPAATAAPVEHEPGTQLEYRVAFSDDETVPAVQAASEKPDGQGETLPAETVPVVHVPIIEHHLTWHRVVRLPWGAIRAAIGGVNETDFLGAAPESLLFHGVQAEREFAGIDPQGEPQFAWRLSYVFKEKTAKYKLDPGMPAQIYGWNHVLRSPPGESPGLERPTDSAGNTLYPLANLSALFFPDPPAS